MQVSKWLGHSSFVLTLTTYADYISERRRRLVAHRFRRTDRRALYRQPRRRFSELADLLGINHPVAFQIPGLLAVPGDSVLTCDHVDHRAHPASRCFDVCAASRAVGLPAVTRQCATLQQCRQRVSAALGDGAGILAAHRGRHL